MNSIRRFTTACVAACACIGATAGPASAIVGGSDAPAGKYTSVAEVSFGIGLEFQCTGTLIAPTWVLTAGHCGSVTSEAVASPVAWPAPLINVRIGSTQRGQGELVPVSSATVNPNYLLNSGYDITLLKLSRASAKAPTKVSGTGEGYLWAPGTLETIAGFGATSEGGSTSNTLKEAQVPITTDATCGAAYSNFDAATMICAGYPQGGVDSCQGDSGGPMFASSGSGLKVVGVTSFGDGCARAGSPGVYARVGDTTLREWIRSKAPDAVD